MTRTRLVLVSLALLAACGGEAPKPPAAGPSSGPSPTPSETGAGGYGYAAVLGADLDKKAGDALVKGRKWLLSQRDEASGAWKGPEGSTAAGFTGLATVGWIGTLPREAVGTDPVVLKALEFLAAAQKEDGSIFSNPQYVNYETSICIAAFAQARVARFASVQAKARDFLVKSQILDEANAAYGGFPYQSKKDPTRPADLSNAQFAVQAAHEAGVTDSAFWARVTAYLARVQNRSETNSFSVRKEDKDLGREVEVVSGNDGGAAYAPGVSMAGLVERPDGKFEPRSYGSMTYALLKCLLFAGAKGDDPRVVAAVGWLARNFTVDRNPGFENAAQPEQAGQQGYFYYLLTMSRALAEYERVTGKPLVVTDGGGRAREWRREVAAKLASLQGADGSWTNPNDRWEEGLPFICTSYALQTLAICQGRLP